MLKSTSFRQPDFLERFLAMLGLEIASKPPSAEMQAIAARRQNAAAPQANIPAPISSSLTGAMAGPPDKREQKGIVEGARILDSGIKDVFGSESSVAQVAALKYATEKAFGKGSLVAKGAAGLDHAVGTAQNAVGNLLASAGLDFWNR